MWILVGIMVALCAVVYFIDKAISIPADLYDEKVFKDEEELFMGSTSELAEEHTADRKIKKFDKNGRAYYVKAKPSKS